MCSASQWSGYNPLGQPLLESHLSHHMKHAGQSGGNQSDQVHLWGTLSSTKWFSPPLSSLGDLGAAPSGLHLSARSTPPWLGSIEGVMGSGEGVSAPPELGLTGTLIPFLLTTFRKAVLPIF